MGWWSESIMGGDEPLDIEGCFDDEFGENKSALTADAAVEFINGDMVNKYGFEPAIVKQVTGYLTIKRAGPFNDELRRLVIEGIDEELEDTSDWSEPELRVATLNEFKRLVEAYPDTGALVNMPNQPGLFDKLAEHLGQAD